MLDSRFSFLRRVRDLTRIHKLVKVSEKQQAVRIQEIFHFNKEEVAAFELLLYPM